MTFIGEKHDLSKNKFQNFWSETNTFNIFHNMIVGARWQASSNLSVKQFGSI
jgi:hypothetical protein